MDKNARVWPRLAAAKNRSRSLRFLRLFAWRGAEGWSGRFRVGLAGTGLRGASTLAGRKRGPFAVRGRDAREPNCVSLTGWRGLSVEAFRPFPEPRALATQRPGAPAPPPPF